MADIRVEKKNRPVWPWILGILLLAAIIWIIADDNDREPADQIGTVYEEPADRNSRNNGLRDNDNRFGNNDRNDTLNNDARGAAMAYVNFIKDNDQKITKDHEYSKQALTHLSRALNSVANQNNVSIEDKQKLDELRKKADQLVQNKSSKEHADKLSDAFASAADIIQNLQRKQFPDLKEEADDVKNAADRVRPNVVVTNQKDAVKNFFDKSADAIKSMAENGSRNEDV